MRNSIIFILSLICITACSNEKVSTSWTENDFLKVDGKFIRNNHGKGDTISLKGINLGGWLLREGWMDPIGFENTNTEETLDDYVSRQIMIERFGEQTTDEMLDVYQKLYIQESDLDVIKSLGLNFIRVPFYWQEIMDQHGEIKSHGFNQLDWIVKEAKKRKMYVILDLHGAPGGHSDGYLTGGQSGSNMLWTNSTYQQWTENIWKTIASRYKNDPTVLGYDLLNEPVASKDSNLSIIDIYDRLYKAVRNIDANHIILMGAFYNFDFLCNPTDRGWTNVIYQTHHYGADNRENKSIQEKFMKEQLEYLKEYRDKWNIPVYAGEYSFWNHYDLWETWMTSLSKEHIMWSSWTYKNTDCSPINNWGIYVCNENPKPNVRLDAKEEILKKWQMFSSDYYKRNDSLYNTIRKCAIK